MAYHILRSPHGSVEWNYWFDVRYGRHVLHIISIPVRFGTFMSNDGSRKNYNVCLIIFELRNIYTETKKNQRDVLRSIITFYDRND